MAARRVRVDALLVERGLAPDRARAEALLRAGRVLLDERPIDKPGTSVPPDAALRLRAEPLRFVSRGGEKLHRALHDLGLDPRECVAADLGASTGGFTDCLLQRGAARVYAIDVGYGQLAWSLRQDPRVVVMERTNARLLASLPEPVDWLVADLSFIRLESVLPAILRLARPEATAVLLIKPQFQLPPHDLAAGGRVEGAEARERAVAEVCAAALAAGCQLRGRAQSALPGARAGNIEIFVHLSLPASMEAR